MNYLPMTGDIRSTGVAGFDNRLHMDLTYSVNV